MLIGSQEAVGSLSIEFASLLTKRLDVRRLNGNRLVSRGAKERPNHERDSDRHHQREEYIEHAQIISAALGNPAFCGAKYALCLK